MSNMQLDTLRRIVQEINASTSLHESLDIMVNHVAKAMQVDVCSIYLLDERNQRYLLMASKGLNAESVGHVSLQTGEGLVGLVGQREEIVNLDNAPKHERFLFCQKLVKNFITLFLAFQSCTVARSWAYWLSKTRSHRIFPKLPNLFWLRSVPSFQA